VRRRWVGTAVIGGCAAVLTLVVGCSSAEPTTAGAAPTSAAPATTSAYSSATSSTPAPEDKETATSPSALQPVESGELIAFRAEHEGVPIVDAQSSGLARYNTSDRCEVPGQPCYDAPTYDRVARIDLGAPPQVPGTDTTFVTGHSNRYHPEDPKRGVFSRLQEVRTGDTVVLTTTKGVFTYAVTTVLTVPFDKLTSTDEVVRVRADTVVAISCVVAPNGGPYLGNYVVIGTLRRSAPR
jgi:LPXTG-site transpeptidase (sortase) family protein